MNKNSSLLSNPLLLGIGGLVVGLLIGWLILGAVALPPTVRVSNVDPVDLKSEYKQQWTVDVADAYAVTQDLTTARNHLRWFTNEEIEQYLRFAFTERNTKNDAEGAARVASFAQVLGLNISTTGATSPTPGTGTTGTGTSTASGSMFDSLGQLLLILAGIILLVALGLFLYMRMRGGTNAPRPAAQTAAPAGASGGTTSYARPEPVVTQPGSFADEPPSAPAIAAAATGAAVASRTTTPLTKSLGTFAATYKFGEDNYDTSFTLETARGEFLGETGMGSSETIGEGKPDKVTAFDIWLFDKTDVRTVTQILMSEAAFNDQATRQRLATKGELVLAEKGKHVRLETATLAVDCEIVDLVYASTPGLPPNSHFQKLIVEMVPAQK
jgi:hypothetical protein